MKRCIELASKAGGMTYPNPLVGSVIVHNGKITGEGFHLRSGLPHAEVNAINSVRNKEKLRESTLYVNLEPCSHFGKTPPCADLIISCSIPKVVIGSVDTSEKVSGAGIEKLRNAGCEVITGVMEQECRIINKRFFTFNEKKRPYIILKWAQSQDGFIDVTRSETSEAKPYWISGKPERVLVHKWRAEEQAVLAGAGTVRTDRPRLNVRDWTGKDPLRLILSSSGDVGSIETSGSKIIVFTHKNDAVIPGAEIVSLDVDKPSGPQITDYLYSIGIQSLFIEGGAQVLRHFIMSDLWDEARVFKGRSCFRDGVRAPQIKGSPVSKETFRGSSLHIYVNKL